MIASSTSAKFSVLAIFGTAIGLIAIGIMAAGLFIIYRKRRLLDSKTTKNLETIPMQTNGVTSYGEIRAEYQQPQVFDFSSFGEIDGDFESREFQSHKEESESWKYHLEPLKGQRNSSNSSSPLSEKEKKNIPFVVGSDDETDSGEMWKSGGKLKLSFSYDQNVLMFTVTILEAYDVPILEKNRGSSQVRLTLLPEKRQKFKTKVLQGPNPRYKEKFCFTGLRPSDLERSTLRIRLYCHRTVHEVCLAGEAEIPFAEIQLGRDQLNMQVTLYPPANGLELPFSSSAGSNLKAGDRNFRSFNPMNDSKIAIGTESPKHPLDKDIPQILVGLMYSRNTGKLVVSVLKCQSLGIFEKSPDSYVQLTMLSAYGDDIGTRKTTIKKNSDHPCFDESFVFQVMESELPFVTLVVTVYGMIGSVWRRRVVVGWMPLGECEGCDRESKNHWMDMKDSNEATIARWHKLREGECENLLQP